MQNYIWEHEFKHGQLEALAYYLKHCKYAIVKVCPQIVALRKC